MTKSTNICKNFNSEQGCKYEDKCRFRHVSEKEQQEQQQSSQEQQVQNLEQQEQQNDIQNDASQQQTQEKQSQNEEKQQNQNQNETNENLTQGQEGLQQQQQSQTLENKKESVGQVAQQGSKIQKKEEIEAQQNQRWDNLESDNDESEQESSYSTQQTSQQQQQYISSHQTYSQKRQFNQQRKPYNQNYKNQNRGQLICRYFELGTCNKGDQCQFSHQISSSQLKYQQQSQSRNYNNDKRFKKYNQNNQYAPTCKFYLKISCLKENTCEMYHPQIQADPIDPSEFYFDVEDIERTQAVNEQEIEYLNYFLKALKIINNEDNCIIIRHGLSIYNYIASRFVYETGKSFLDKSSTRYQTDQQLLDSQLHYYGHLQAQDAALTIKNQENISYVFVSPLRRSLETAHEIFKNNQKFIDKSIKIIVLPQLMEILSKSQDISISLHKELRSEYEEYGFDFSQFDEQQLKSDDWQLDLLNNKEDVQKIRDYIKDEGEKWHKICLRQIRQNFPEPIETPDSVDKRVEEALQLIQKIKNQDEGKCVIIAHAAVMKSMFKQKQQQQDFYNYKKQIQNCQILSINL